MNHLQEIYNSYYTAANSIKNWQESTKSELCFAYIAEEDNERKQQYIAAIVCRYWPKIYRFYKATSLICTPEDCYDWLIEAILLTLRDRPWERPGDKLARDPNAPDKVINCIMKCTRINYIVAANRDKRRANINAASKEEIDENVGEDTQLPTEILSNAESSSIDIDQQITIKYLYEKQLYLLVFCYDAIINLDCFLSGTFSEKKLIAQLTSLPESYLSIMNERYGISIKELKNAYNSAIASKSKQQLKENVSMAIYNLRYLYFKEEI